MGVLFISRGAVVKGQQCTPVGSQLDQALVFLVGERRVQHLLKRLDLARQAAVLAVDEHGDQGGIWLCDNGHSLNIFRKDPAPSPLWKKPCPS